MFGWQAAGNAVIIQLTRRPVLRPWQTLSASLSRKAAAMIAFDKSSDAAGRPADRNLLGEPLISCSTEPLTGFFRDGTCRTCAEDTGSHTVCAVMTEAFLEFTVKAGNDLVTPRPEYSFAGLLPGDRWCLCAARWLEALQAGCGPPVVLEATSEKALEIVPFELLKQHAVKS
jgi:uncharacterized protein (DUF2237 family)